MICIFSFVFLFSFFHFSFSFVFHSHLILLGGRLGPSLQHMLNCPHRSLKSKQRKPTVFGTSSALFELLRSNSSIFVMNQHILCTYVYIIQYQLLLICILICIFQIQKHQRHRKANVLKHNFPNEQTCHFNGRSCGVGKQTVCGRYMDPNHPKLLCPCL